MIPCNLSKCFTPLRDPSKNRFLQRASLDAVRAPPYAASKFRSCKKRPPAAGVGRAWRTPLRTLPGPPFAHPHAPSVGRATATPRRNLEGWQGKLNDPLRWTLDGFGGPPYAPGAPYIFMTMRCGRRWTGSADSPTRAWSGRQFARRVSHCVGRGLHSPLRRPACPGRNSCTPLRDNVGRVLATPLRGATAGSGFTKSQRWTLDGSGARPTQPHTPTVP